MTCFFFIIIIILAATFTQSLLIDTGKVFKPDRKKLYEKNAVLTLTTARLLIFNQTSTFVRSV